VEVVDIEIACAAANSAESSSPSGQSSNHL